jgi:hypothetical protein
MKLVPTYHWIIRGLIAAAIAAPLGLLALENPVPPPDPELETDLLRVYARLPKQSEFDHLDSWCGLEVSDVKPAEAARLRAEVEASPDPEQFWAIPLDRPSRVPATYELPDNLRWYRLTSRGDGARWIAIGVWATYKENLMQAMDTDGNVLYDAGKNSGRTEYWIRCRVPVGFQPNPS